MTDQINRISLPYKERRRIMAVLDFLLLNISYMFVLLARPDITLGTEDLSRVILWFFFLDLFWYPIATAFGAYDIGVAGRMLKISETMAKAGLLTMGLYLLIPYLTPPLPSSRWQLFLTLLFPTNNLILGRCLYVLLLGSSKLKRRVLIYGAGWAGTSLAREMLESKDITYQLVGFIDDDPELQDADIVFKDVLLKGNEQAEVELRVLGDGEKLNQIVTQNNVNTVVMAITYDISGKLLQRMTDCLEHGVELLPMPVLYEQITGKIPVQHVGDHWSVSMPINHPGTGAIRPLVKRVFDLVSAGIGTIFLGIAMPFIALAICIDSPGPIFYRQTRVGKGGRLFRVYKFRSMVPNAEENGAVWAEKNDSRVTRVGKFLRATHIDEFPQFFNILRGEMSAVGPRPERPEFVEELEKEIPFYRVRHAVKPGMAGWGLVNQGYGASKKDAMIKLQYDLYYIKHQSLWLDVVILLKTIFDTVTFGGR